MTKLYTFDKHTYAPELGCAVIDDNGGYDTSPRIIMMLNTALAKGTEISELLLYVLDSTDPASPIFEDPRVKSFMEATRAAKMAAEAKAVIEAKAQAKAKEIARIKELARQQVIAKLTDEEKDALRLNKPPAPARKGPKKARMAFERVVPTFSFL
mgnify:CR=1 FL=1